MKTQKYLLSISLLALLVLAVACQKDERSSVGFTMKAAGASEFSNGNSYEEPIFTTSVDPSNDIPLRFTWSEAWIYITRLEFSASLITPSVGEIKQDPDIHITWNGNQKVDLLGEPKIFASLEIPDGHYRDIYLSLTSSRLNDMIPPNFYFEGTYGPVTNGIPIAVSVNQEFTMEMKFENGTINAQSGNFLDGQVIVSLDGLFNGITREDLDRAELTNGTLLISATHNPDLYLKILANLQVKPPDENIGSLAWYFHIKPN
jgi:hypothetical protein